MSINPSFTEALKYLERKEKIPSHLIQDIYKALIIGSDLDINDEEIIESCRIDFIKTFEKSVKLSEN